jgi:sugar phosphate permease
VVAPTLLLMWVVGQVDKTHISLIIADRSFLSELHLAGRNTELGWLMGAFFLGYGISIFFWGFLVDRFGPRICAITGASCWAVVLFFASRANSYQELVIIRFFLGVAEGNLWPVGNALTNRWFPVREHARVQAFWVMGSPLGTAIGVPIVAALILQSNWRGALEFLAIASALPVAFLLLIKDSPAQQKGMRQSEIDDIVNDRMKAALVERMTFLELLKSKAFWLIALCHVSSATTLYTVIHWLPSFLTSTHQISYGAMSTLIFWGYLIAMGGTLLAAYFADRTMQRPLVGVWLSVLFSFTIMPAVLFFPPALAGIVIASLTAVPTAYAALNGALLHTMVRPEAIARGTGIYIGFANTISSLGEPVFGALVTGQDGQYWAGFLFLAILNLLTAMGYYALHRLESAPIDAIAPAPRLAVSSD